MTIPDKIAKQHGLSKAVDIIAAATAHKFLVVILNSQEEIDR